MCAPVTLGWTIVSWSPPEAAVPAASSIAILVAAVALARAGAGAAPVVAGALTACRMAKAPREGAVQEVHKRRAASAGPVATKSSFVAPLGVPDRMGRSVSAEPAG